MPLPDLDSGVGQAFRLELDGVSIPLMDVVGLVLSAGGGGSVTLVRALTTNQSFVQWSRDARHRDPTTARRATIRVSAADGSPVARYRLENAWPSHLEIGSLKGGDGLGVITERLTLRYDRVDVEESLG